MRAISLLIVLMPNLLGAGCRPFTRAADQSTQSAFLSQFSFQRTAWGVKSGGIDCQVSGAGNGMAATAGTGPGGITHSQTTTISCEVHGSAGVDESEVLHSLKSDVEKQIQDSGARILGSGFGSDRFHIDYVDGSIRGRVVISGQPGERYYSLTARVDETNK